MNNKNKIKSSAIYLLGITALVVTLGLALYLNRETGLETRVNQYVLSKQEIRDALGEVTQTRITEGSKPHYTALVRGANKTGLLRFKAVQTEGIWSLADIVLSVNGQVHHLSPLGVANVALYAASTSSAPLREAVYAKGEKIFIKSVVVPYAESAGDVVTQSVEIYNEDSEVIGAATDVASATVGPNKPLVFTSDIGALSPGVYDVRLTFRSTQAKQSEVFWQRLKVKQLRHTPVVKSVRYYLDQAHKTRTEPLFTASQPLFVTLNLAGFTVNQDKISGIVDLKVTNARGEVVANKPKFAEFTQDYDESKALAVNGELKLKEPDVYLLSFKIKDFFSKAEITHDEKVIVSRTP